MATLYSNLSPGTYIEERDLSTRADIAVSTTGAFVFESKRGPVTPTFVPTYQRWLELYGKADASVTFAHYNAKAFFARSKQAWGLRVVNGALHAGLVYYKDTNSQWGVAANATSGRVLSMQYPIGAVNGFTSGVRPFLTLTFSAGLVALNSFTMTVTDGVTSQTVGPVAYATSSDNTMTLIASAINTALASFGTGGTATVHTETVNSGNRVIRILPPANSSLTFGGAAVTLGTSQATVAINTDARLFDVLAENPGAWGNDYGVRITNNNIGQRQRFKITISSPLVASNVFSVTLNGRVISTTYATSSDATLAALATAIAADPDVASASVVAVAGATNNDRSITVIAKAAGPTAVSILAASVTGGASQATGLVQETLKGIVSDNEFDFEIFSRSNLAIPVERFRSTLAVQTSANGTQTAIDKRINLSTGSQNIRVVVPDSARSYVFNPTASGNYWTVDTSVNFLGGGDDGLKVLNSQLANAWATFQSRDKYPVRLLVNCGYTDIAVHQAITAVAEQRQDAVAILDMPADKQATQDAFNYRQFEINIDSSYAAIYSPDLKVRDEDSDTVLYIPPSGHIAGVYAFTDSDASVWHAPAGLNRGKLPEVLGLRYDYSLGDRELLHPVGVNFIIDKAGVGPVVFAEETLQTKKSALSSVHTRRLLNALEIAYSDALDYTALFEPNNSFTRYQAVQVGERLLAPIKRAGGLYAYTIQCDDDNNPPELIDMDVLRVDVYVQPTRTAKRVLLRLVLQRTGASFAESIKLLNDAA